MVDGQVLVQVKFCEMFEGMKEDWDIIVEYFKGFNKGLVKCVIDYLRLLDGDFGGFLVDCLIYFLQIVMCVYCDGCDEEYVVCVLLYDIGDMFGSYNYLDVVVVILKLFVLEKNYWMVVNYGMFQGYYFFYYFGLDWNMCDQFKDYFYYEYIVQFCYLYDQVVFDLDYESELLDFFEFMVECLFVQLKNFMYLKVFEESQVLLG